MVRRTTSKNCATGSIRTLTHRHELYGIAALFLIVFALAYVATPRIEAGGGCGYDGCSYAAMAAQMAAAERVHADPPFVWRVAVPFIVSLLHHA